MQTSGAALTRNLAGRAVVASRDFDLEDVSLRLLAHRHEQDVLLVPSVPEPYLVWVSSGAATVEERDFGTSAWQASRVAAGDFFLTHSDAPYELRWRAEGKTRFEVLHVVLSLPLYQRAAREALSREVRELPALREVSGARDAVVSALLGLLHAELGRVRPSALFVRGIAQSLAVHLVRHYRDAEATPPGARGGLAAFKLRKVVRHLEQHLAEPFHLGTLARIAALSEFHFSRAFKKNVGYSPSQYLIRLRVEHARRLLRETDRPVIEVGLAVGYSSPSRFAEVFRRETGLSPTEYRG